LYVDEEEEIQYGPMFSFDFPDRERVDTLFRVVSSMYYRQKPIENGARGPPPEKLLANGTSQIQDQNVLEHCDYDILRYPTLDMLLSPLRKRSPLDDWSPREVALFEAGICRFGKDFYSIGKIIQTKTTNEVVEFYYHCFKPSIHYKLWKQNKNHCFLNESSVIAFFSSFGCVYHS
jgi:hypothetical protein